MLPSLNHESPLLLLATHHFVSCFCSCRHLVVTSISFLLLLSLIMIDANNNANDMEYDDTAAAGGVPPLPPLPPPPPVDGNEEAPPPFDPPPFDLTGIEGIREGITHDEVV